MFIPLFTGKYTSQVVQDFFHEQYGLDLRIFDSDSQKVPKHILPNGGESHGRIRKKNHPTKHIQAYENDGQLDFQNKLTQISRTNQAEGCLPHIHNLVQLSKSLLCLDPCLSNLSG